MGGSDSGGGFATLTHARLRAAQGDVPGAARILRVILEAEPGHREAREFLASLDGRVAVVYREAPEPSLHAVRPAVAAELSGTFKRVIEGKTPSARLHAWIERVRRNRGERRVR
jgi:alkyl sulfatase BDS1-like metallo-beta-lactamase superfamily hydrolase